MERGVKYSYRVEAAAEVVTTFPDQGNVVWMRDFVTGEQIGEKIASAPRLAGRASVYTDRVSLNPIPGKRAAYGMYTPDLKPKTIYTIEITFGEIEGKGDFSVALSHPDHSWGKDFARVEQLQSNKTYVFETKSGNPDWTEVYLEVDSRNGDRPRVQIMKILVLEKQTEQTEG